MDTNRKEHRKNYWREKYQAPEWGYDIHFALFPTQKINREGFFSGLKINTTQTSQDLQELASLYRLATGVRILDYGCGSGDLLLKLATALPNVEGIGIDVAETAIEYAKTHIASGHANLQFLVGDIETLQEQTGPFDIIVCRDMYYTLDPGEQDILLRTCAKLLRPGAFYMSPILPLRQTQSTHFVFLFSIDSTLGSPLHGR